MNSVIHVNIDAINLKIRSGISILQACELANIVIPRFCYHERLSVAGNCRMCLVEIDKTPKLQVSCAIPVLDKMIIKTNSPLVLKAREGILEFLLVNHPLDCPICDQGGECDLQDQSLVYGGDKNRFKEFKRAAEDKYCGPLVKTVMTRCIHCTRCVRFINEIVGSPFLGSIGRGNSIEIGSYIEKLFFSELSGNIIDLCPVGALTSKPYAFIARPWEIKSIESIDILDSIHSNIRLDTKGYDIIRILPRLNEFINEEWISDKIRFAFDGLFVQRLTRPMIKNNEGIFSGISWEKALNIIHSKTLDSVNKKPFNIGLVIGFFCDFESIVFLKRLTHLLNVSILSNDKDCSLNSDFHNLFKFNTSFTSLNKSDVCLVLGVNPRTDGVLLNYHLKKRYLKGNFILAYFGSYLNLMFPTLHLGCSLYRFLSLVEGKNYFCKYLRKSTNPMVIIGKAFLNRIKDINSNLFPNFFLSNLNLKDHSWNVLNFFNLNTKDFCFYDLCINYNLNLVKRKFDLLFVIEDSDCLPEFLNSSFTVFLGHHGCLNAQKSNLVLPTTSFVEKNARFANFQGRYQNCYPALSSLGCSKDSSVVIFNILTSFWYLENTILLSDFISFLVPSINYSLNKTCSYFFCDSSFFYDIFSFSNSYFFSSTIDNFYKTDVITEYSLNMSKCSKELLDKLPFKL